MLRPVYLLVTCLGITTTILTGANELCLFRRLLEARIPVPVCRKNASCSASQDASIGAHHIAESNVALDNLFHEVIQSYSPEVRRVLETIWNDPQKRVIANENIYQQGKAAVVSISIDPETSNIRTQVQTHPSILKSDLLIKLELLHELQHVGQIFERVERVGKIAFATEMDSPDWRKFTEMSAASVAFLSSRSVPLEHIIFEIDRVVTDPDLALDLKGHFTAIRRSTSQQRLANRVQAQNNGYEVSREDLALFRARLAEEFAKFGEGRTETSSPSAITPYVIIVSP